MVYKKHQKEYHTTISEPAAWGDLWDRSRGAWHLAAQRENVIATAIRALPSFFCVRVHVSDVDPCSSVVWIAGDRDDAIPWSMIALQRAMVSLHDAQPSVSF